jgi:hypothetical protein
MIGANKSVAENDSSIWSAEKIKNTSRQQTSMRTIARPFWDESLNEDRMDRDARFSYGSREVEHAASLYRSCIHRGGTASDWITSFVMLGRERLPSDAFGESVCPTA